MGDRSRSTRQPASQVGACLDHVPRSPTIVRPRPGSAAARRADPRPSLRNADPGGPEITTMLDLIRDLAIENETKIVLLVADGLGGLPMEPGGPTELEAASTPHLDATGGRERLRSFHPGGARDHARQRPGAPRAVRLRSAPLQHRSRRARGARDRLRSPAGRRRRARQLLHGRAGRRDHRPPRRADQHGRVPHVSWTS